MVANTFNRRSRRLGFQSLEERTLMAGDVAVKVNPFGDLLITGDANYNDVAIVQKVQRGVPISGSYFISGLPGTKINGGTAGINVSGVTHDFKINLGGGGDTLRLGPDLTSGSPNPSQFIVPHDLTVNLGSGGSTSFIANGITVRNNTFILSGYGVQDDFNIRGLFYNDVTIVSSAGFCNFDMHNSFVSSDLLIQTRLDGHAAETKIDLFQMNVGHNLQISTFNSADYVTIDSVGVNHNLSVFTGDNADVVSISNSEATDGLFASLGDGNDILEIKDTFGGYASLDGGDGFYDRVYESGVKFNTHRLYDFERVNR